MTKKFDVVIGNPPYQEEAQGEGTRDTPVYHLFMDAAYEVARKAVLITPARFLFNAGFTPKAWNRKMLSDPHLSVPYYVRVSEDLFPGTNIMGGIAVSYRDEDSEGEPIGTFTEYIHLNRILRKVSDMGDQALGDIGITTSQSYRYLDALYIDHPDAVALRPVGNLPLISTNTLDQFSFLYHSTKPEDNQPYRQVYGLIGGKRVFRWIRADYIAGPKSLSSYKVAVPASRGHLGTLGHEQALIIGHPTLLPPETAVTQSFITIGAFNSEADANACLKYLKSKFARVMVGVLKVTQHNASGVWKHVPLQDFTADSDIDWTKSIPEIDQQLYARYGLTDEEIEFIETHVKPME